MVYSGLYLLGVSNPTAISGAKCQEKDACRQNPCCPISYNGKDEKHNLFHHSFCTRRHRPKHLPQHPPYVGLRVQAYILRQGNFSHCSGGGNDRCGLEDLAKGRPKVHLQRIIGWVGSSPRAKGFRLGSCPRHQLVLQG